MGFIGNTAIILSGAMLMLGSSAQANDKQLPVVSNVERIRALVESGAIKGLAECPDDQFIECAGIFEERKLANEQRVEEVRRTARTSEEFPESLLGRWETLLSNCAVEDPYQLPVSPTGWVATFSNEGGAGMSFANHETEGGFCAPETISEDGAGIRIDGGCMMEESEVEGGYRIELSVAGHFLTLAARPGSDPGMKFYRCEKQANPSARMTTLDTAAIQSRPKTCSAGPDRTLWKSSDGKVIAYRPIDSTPTIGTMIFEGWNGPTMQWKATARYGCSNGISVCSVTIPMARADDITGQVLAIEENGQYPYLAMPELGHQVAWIQVHQMSEPSVKAGWFDPTISRNDRPKILIPSYMMAAGCVRDRGAYD